MKKLLIFTTLIVSGLFISCQQNSVNSEDPETQQISAIQEIISDSIDIMYDALDDEVEENMMIDEPNWLSGSEASLSKIDGLRDKTRTRYARIKKEFEKNIQVILDTDSTATAYVHIKYTGVLVVKKAQMINDTLTYERFEKPMVHEADRIVKLSKFRNTNKPRKNWRVTAISMKEGQSADPGVDIVELVVKPAGMDSVVITDPLSYFHGKVMNFDYPRYTEITLRVKVKNSTVEPIVYPDGTTSTESVVLHYGRGRKQGHLNFARSWFNWVGQDAEGNNVYEGTWVVKQFFGIHHAVIDVIDNGTLMINDADQYPYVSNTWGTHYKVRM